LIEYEPKLRRAVPAQSEQPDLSWIPHSAGWDAGKSKSTYHSQNSLIELLHSS